MYTWKDRVFTPLVFVLLLPVFIPLWIIQGIHRACEWVLEKIWNS